MLRVTGAALVLAAMFVSLPAGAEVCVRPDLLATFPADGDQSVPPNATLTAKYDPTAEYLENDAVNLKHGGGDPEPMPVSFDDKEGLLTVVPPNGLSPGDPYVVEWPSLRGIGTASKGRGAKVSFSVSSKEDTKAPTFEGLTHIDWDVERDRDDCTNGVEERFRFDLTPGKASDDSGTKSLQLVIYQSHGGDADRAGGALQVAIVPLPEPGGTVSILQSIDSSEGNVCFAALVRDLTGKVSGGTNREVCTHATPPPFFYGCSISGPGRTAPNEAPLAVALIALSLWAMRRHRPAP